MTLTYTMEKLTSQADAFLFATLGHERPSQFDFSARDVDNWRIRSNVHAISVEVQSGDEGGVTIGIWNDAEHSLAPLSYVGSVTCLYHEVSAPALCPATRRGECNGQGSCESESGTPMCSCEDGWFGSVCDERTAEVSEESLQSGSPVRLGVYSVSARESLFIELLTPSGASGRRMVVQVADLNAWLAISMNSGSRRPSMFHPKRSNFHNWPAGSTVPTTPSRVVVESVDSSSYSIMVTNPMDIGSVEFELQVAFDGAPDVSRSPDDSLMLLGSGQDDTSIDFCDPRVPTAEIREDGELPVPLLIMTSRTGIRGVAGCHEMRLLKVEELCRNSRTGFYRTCSNSEGNLLVCSNQPLVLFHGLGDNRRPRQQIDFKNLTESSVGPPPDSTAHLQHEGEQCAFYAHIPIESVSSFVGVSLRSIGEPGQFTAVMNGHHRFWTTGQGEIRREYPIALIAIVSILVTFIILSTCVWRRWFRKEYKKERRMLILSGYVQDLREKARLRKQEQLKTKELGTQLKAEFKQEIEMKAKTLKVAFKEEHETISPLQRCSGGTDGGTDEDASPMTKKLDKSINTLRRIDTELVVEYEDMVEKKAELDLLFRRRQEQLQQVDAEMKQKAGALAKAEAAIDKITAERRKADSEVDRLISDCAEAELELERRRRTISTGPRTTTDEKPSGPEPPLRRETS